MDGEDAEAQRDTRHGALELKQSGWASLRWVDANITGRISFRVSGSVVSPIYFPTRAEILRPLRIRKREMKSGR
jgi:hypothetical protein